MFYFARFMCLVMAEYLHQEIDKVSLETQEEYEKHPLYPKMVGWQCLYSRFHEVF